MPTDPFTIDSLTAPSRDCFAILPSDTDDLPRVPKALYIGTGGTVRLRAVDSDAAIDFVNVGSGSILDVRAARIHATGTSAADIVGLG